MHASQRRAARRRAGAVIFTAALGAMAFPATRQAKAQDGWLGTTGGNWSDPTKWSKAAPPSAGEDVFITTTFTGSQTINYDYAGPPMTLNFLQIDAQGGTNNFSMGGSDLTISTQENIGVDGNATFTQTGATHSLNGSLLYLAFNPGSTATYTLTGGTLTGANQFIGNSGVGNFNQTGGNNVFASSLALYLGVNVDATGTYALSGGTIDATMTDGELVGYFGTGIFNQSGGTNSFQSNNVYVGYGPGGSGTYTLSAGLLTGPDGVEWVGKDGVGNFNQSGGQNIVGLINVDNGSTYMLSGTGQLSTGGESIGLVSAGSFTQTGGTNTLGAGDAVDLGGNAGSVGTYTLSGGALTSPTVIVGESGKGNFNQSGGSNAVSGSIFLGQNPGATGSYTLSAGTLSVGDTTFVAGKFNAVGGKGTLTVSGSGQLSTPTLTVWNQGSVLLQGGSASSGNTFNTGAIKQTGGVANLGAVTGSGSFTVGGPSGSSASMTVSSLSQSSLLIDTTGSLTLTNPSGSANTVTSLQINNGGLLNINSSAITINYGTGASPNAAVRNYISNAYANPLSPWQGTTGITSSNALADKAHHSIAFADGADTVSPTNPQKVVTNLPAGRSSFAPGGTLADGVELVTYAFAGDANLDGKVDFSDFIILSNHFGASDINWDHGNFNYDANVDFSDFIILSNNFGSGTGGTNGIGAPPQELAQYNAQARAFGISESQIAAWDAAIASVPEPASIGIVSIGAVGLLQRRRRMPQI